MDEGKADRPHWWSRPQEDGGTGRTAPPVSLGKNGGHGGGNGERGGPEDAAAVEATGGGESGGGGPDSASSSPPPGPPTPHGTAPQVPPAEPVEGNPYATPPQGTPVGPPPVAAEPPAPQHPADPYGTPPYGEPGPWAPAPPVQHPAAPQPQPLPVAPPGPWQRYDPWAPPALHSVRTGGPARGSRGGRLAVGALLIALLAGGIGGVTGAYLERHGGVSDVSLPQAPADRGGRPPGSVAAIAASTLPGVAYIHVKGGGEEGTGTGFVLDDDGHIITNNHVVEPAAGSGDISVTFNGGTVRKATIVGRDTGYDLAVIKVDGVSGLKPLPLGNSDSVRVGDPVVAIGAPFDLEGTVTSGIISAKDRPITAGGGSSGGGSDVSYVDALQTDAPINPGNSGGPLVDAQGRVIGINSAIRSADGSGGGSGGTQGGSIGLGFAIPVNQAKRVAEELINTGHATHPVIGVTVDMGYSGAGARIADKGSGGAPAVTPGGPGDKAGLKAGDIITAVDGDPVQGGQELIVKTRSHRPGEHMRLTVRSGSGGATRTVDLVLGSSSGS